METTARNEQAIVDLTAEIGLSGVDDQYLTFILAGEEYGVDILRVQEIKGWDKVTHIPNTPDYLLGVINLRGAIVPVVDLRQRFAMEKLEYSPTTVVIVLRVRGADRERIMGVVVDAVSDVYSIPEEEFKPVPPKGNSPVMESVKALASVEDKMIILLDIDHLLNSGELTDLDGVTA